MELEPEYNIIGKTLVITDLHIGLKKSNVSRLSIIVKVFKRLFAEIKKNQIKNVICCGDVFHSRVTLDLQVINVAIKLMTALASKTKVYLIIGNHDIYYKNTINVNSTNIFRETKNIVIIEQPTIVSLNGKSALFVPWHSDLTKYQENTFDFLFGHFDIDAKYLIASYIEEHSAKTATSDSLLEILNSDDMLQSESFSVITSETLNSEVSEILSTKKKSNDLVGSFVKLAKENTGVVFSGHIHQRKEFIANKRKFIFVGSPYQQNFGEMDSVDGFYTMFEDGTYKFTEITDVPKHIKIRISSVLKTGVDNFDFSIVAGNIIKKIYDKDIDRETEWKINQKIADFSPFEEALPDYEVSITSDDGEITNESLELIKKSKLDYIKNYIDNVDESVLKENNLEKTRLFELLEHYYNKAVENIEI